VGAAEIECFQPGADDVVTKLFHDPLADFGIPSSTYGRTLEEKVIPIVTPGLRKGVISGLTARQGFVLSPVPEFGSSNAEAFQVGQQMVARADPPGRHVGICGLE
jgi:hypothetical protein